MGTIREARPEDRAGIARVLSELHPGQGEADGSSLPVVRQEARTFVATSGDQVIGVVVATLVDYGLSSYGMVEELVVAGGHRGSGVGSGLLSRCREWLADSGVEVVFVSAVDADAAGFYGSTGFTPCVGPWLFWVPPTKRAPDRVE